jgi:hypothetical protein
LTQRRCRHRRRYRAPPPPAAAVPPVAAAPPRRFQRPPLPRADAAAARRRCRAPRRRRRHARHAADAAQCNLFLTMRLEPLQDIYDLFAQDNNLDFKVSDDVAFRTDGIMSEGTRIAAEVFAPTTEAHKRQAPHHRHEPCDPVTDMRSASCPA